MSRNQEEPLSLSFENYHQEQPLFQKVPNLIEKVRGGIENRNDLIYLNSLNYPDHSRRDNFFLQNSNYLSVDSRLPLEIPNFLLEKYNSDQISIRIHPYEIYSEEPEEYIKKATFRPPDPNWIENISLHLNEKKGSKFVPIENSEDFDEQIDYLEQIKMFETFATLRKANHFTMSLEEIQNCKDDMLIGRYIHLDALNVLNVPFQDAKLNHLDLAINVYKNESRESRLNQSLSSEGNVESASYRTHLIRIDNIMFADLIQIAHMFFQSKSLIKQWEESQFKKLE
ncbi:hypothetical protein [uncultured Marinococcus sp.]|uniref:hypothetical protein n=1 Tax=uncultured Marinococcus sp. TaxID=487012 RepID=UPI00260BC06A|nr:hypothetical protein [uncultured Marinococcus sp.]